MLRVTQRKGEFRVFLVTQHFAADGTSRRVLGYSQASLRDLNPSLPTLNSGP